MDRFPVVEIAGTPFEMGRQYGAGYRDLIVRSLETYGKLARRFGADAETRALAMAAASLPAAEAYAPDLVEEIRGIAAGAGLPFETIFSLNASLDALGALGMNQFRGVEVLACSTYGVTAPVAADGETYVGWNADDSEWWLPSCVLIRGRPEGGLPFLSWTFAGFIGRPGLNPYLAITANGIAPLDYGHGVPYPLLCRKALQQTTTAAAVRAIAEPKRMFGMNYMVGDRSGTIASLEVSGEQHAVIPARNGWVVHTNHYVDAELTAQFGIADSRPGRQNTRLRLCRWYELMAPHDRLTRADLEAMHRDHRYAPDAICRHAEGEGDSITLASMICAPRLGRMWVAYGLPCEHPFVEYSLS